MIRGESSVFGLDFIPNRIQTELIRFQIYETESKPNLDSIQSNPNRNNSVLEIESKPNRIFFGPVILGLNIVQSIISFFLKNSVHNNIIY